MTERLGVGLSTDSNVKLFIDSLPEHVFSAIQSFNLSIEMRADSKRPTDLV
jgi:hypothetical protein